MKAICGSAWHAQACHGAGMHMTGLTRAVAQVAGLLVGSFGAPVVAARLCTAVHWLSVLRLVRLPRAFSIVKASLLPHSSCFFACAPASERVSLLRMCLTVQSRSFWTDCPNLCQNSAGCLCETRPSPAPGRIIAGAWHALHDSTDKRAKSMSWCRRCLWSHLEGTWGAGSWV